MTSTTPPHLGGHMGVTHVDVGGLNLALDVLADTWRPSRVLIDLGCGPGGQVLAARESGIEAYGIDGDPALIEFPIWKEHPEWFQTHDFVTGPPPLSNVEAGDFRWIVQVVFWPQPYALAVWCVEFLEHLEERFLPNLIPVFRKANIVLTTTPLPGTPGGHHHVNVQPPDYWGTFMTLCGLQRNDELTERWRKESTMGREFVRQTGIVWA